MHQFIGGAPFVSVISSFTLKIILDQRPLVYWIMPDFRREWKDRTNCSTLNRCHTCQELENLTLLLKPQQTGSLSGAPSREHHGVRMVEMPTPLGLNIAAEVLKLWGGQVGRKIMQTETMVKARCVSRQLLSNVPHFGDLRNELNGPIWS